MSGGAAASAGGLVAVVVAVASCVVPLARTDATAAAGGAGDEGAARPASGCAPTRGQLVLEWVNEMRAAHGLPTFVVDPRLADAAARHSQDQARHRFSGHVGSDRSTVGERARRAGYAWAMVAENVAQGYPTARAVVAGWMDSPPHRATILSPGAVHAGVGYAAGPADMRHVWTLVVAEPATPAPDAVVRCHP